MKVDHGRARRVAATLLAVSTDHLPAAGVGEDGPPGPGFVHEETFRLGLDGVDAFSIIFFGMYSIWHQHALEGLMEAGGHPLRSTIDDGYGFPVAAFEMQFHRPVRLGDTVRARCRIVRVGNRSMHVETLFLGPDDEPCAEAKAVHVATTKGFEPAAVPAGLRALAGGEDGPALR